MPVIQLSTFIAAPIERVFDLARSIDLHTDSTSRTGERAVSGITSGLIGPEQEVTWRARHFGVWQSLTVRVTAFERPTHFADAMLRGAFRRMRTRHRRRWPLPDQPPRHRHPCTHPRRRRGTRRLVTEIGRASCRERV